MSVRERQKAMRQSRILDAAERLIRKTGGTDFPMRSLADAAEVSFATPFNLLRSKEGVLYALLLRSLDNFVAEGLTFKSTDPAYHVIEAAETAVDVFAHDPKFLRPLYRVLLGVNDREYRPLFMRRTFAYWKTAALTIPNCPALDDLRMLDTVSHALMAQFIGLLELWVQEDLDNAAFRRRAICGVILSVLGVVNQRHVPFLRKHLNANLESGVE